MGGTQGQLEARAARQLLLKAASVTTLVPERQYRTYKIGFARVTAHNIHVITRAAAVRVAGAGRYSAQ